MDATESKYPCWCSCCPHKPKWLRNKSDGSYHKHTLARKMKRKLLIIDDAVDPIRTELDTLLRAASRGNADLISSFGSLQSSISARVPANIIAGYAEMELRSCDEEEKPSLKVVEARKEKPTCTDDDRLFFNELNASDVTMTDAVLADLEDSLKAKLAAVKLKQMQRANSAKREVYMLLFNYYRERSGYSQTIDVPTV